VVPPARAAQVKLVFFSYLVSTHEDTRFRIEVASGGRARKEIEDVISLSVSQCMATMPFLREGNEIASNRIFSK
jgi:hypothetical protein